MSDSSKHGFSAIGSADAVDWRQRYFEARDALFQFKYPPDPKLLRDIAAEIDCGSDCEHGNTEWDTNAHVCSRSERKEGCAGEKASCLRLFADAIDVCASLQREALSEGVSPEAVNPSALRAQVIEECAKVAEWGCGECDHHKKVAARIRSLSAVSAIAQERDVGKPVAWFWEWRDGDRWLPSYSREKPNHISQYTQSELERIGIRNVQPLYLHPTTSPSAISEAPTSAEEMVEMPLSDVNNLDEVVRELGIGESFETPAQSRRSGARAGHRRVLRDASRSRSKTEG